MRKHRKRQGLTVNELARQIGIDAGLLSKIERGLRPPPQLVPYVQNMAAALRLEEGTADLKRFTDTAYKVRFRGRSQALPSGPGRFSGLGHFDPAASGAGVAVRHPWLGTLEQSQPPKEILTLRIQDGKLVLDHSPVGNPGAGYTEILPEDHPLQRGFRLDAELPTITPKNDLLLAGWVHQLLDNLKMNPCDAAKVNLQLWNGQEFEFELTISRKGTVEGMKG